MKQRVLTYLIVVAALCSGEKTLAQQMSRYTQYWFNLYDANAAYAGSLHVPAFAVRHREQWMGWEGAPSYSMLSFHMPLANERVGVGAKMTMEQIGSRQWWQIRTSASYRIPFQIGVLAFALAPSIERQSFNLDLVSAQHEEDLQLQSGNTAATLVSFDASVMFTSKRGFIGLEVQQLTQSSYRWTDVSGAQQTLHASLLMGKMIKIGEDDLLALTSHTRVTSSQQLLSELGVSWLWNNRIWLGAGYRIKVGPTAMLEWNITKLLRLGYSFDIPIAATRLYDDGSHEVFLGFTFGNASASSIRKFD